MSKEKKDSVFDFRKPTKFKELKSFIGLCEYFHGHVPHFSDIMRPLHDIMHGYTKATRSRILKWTVSASEAFLQIQREIANCATLHFVHESAPIFLQTDASDYGIGAYLFQLVDGIEKPIAFISKKLDGAQLKWSTIEKEAYAIYYSLRKLDYLIRDSPFTLQTDHKNLVYVNEEPSAKVRRWKLWIQEYMFDIEHIPGELNIVADSLSRLCPFPEEKLDNKIDKNIEEVAISETFFAGLLQPYEVDQNIKRKIAKIHNSNCGHFGVERTYQKCLKQYGAWDGMREHIRMFIRNCPCCQKMSRLKIPIHTNPFTTATYAIMERVAIDTIGPLPEDEDGNKHLIVMIDCFARYVKLYPVKSTEAVHAVKALLQWIGTFGCPSQLLSDNGSQYVNNLIAEFTKIVGTEHVTTMAYSKEENAIVERVNKEVLRHLRAILFEKGLKDKWSLIYPLVERIINSEIHSVIKVSPAQIVFGNAIDLDRGIFLPHFVNDKQMKFSEYTARLLQAQADVIKVAYESQTKSDLHHIAMHTP